MSLKNLFTSIPNGVQWHEGMLLSSHHLQTLDYYHSSLTSVIGRCCNYFNYGITKLELNESSISSGIIQVNAVEGIMKDGTIINYNINNSTYKLELSISNEIQTNNKLKIFLCILKHQYGNNNFSGNHPRYFSTISEDIKDENTGKTPINIPSKQPLFFLSSNLEEIKNCVYIPIIEIQKNNNIINSTNFVPPYIYILRESTIYTLTSNIIKNLKEKIGYIITRKNPKKDNNILDIALRLLASYSMSIESILNTEYVTPFEVYKHLLNLTSNLLSLYISNIVPVLPIYKHDDIMQCFNNLNEYIEKSLTQIIEFSSAIPFILSNSTFSLKLLKDWETKLNLIIAIKRSNHMTKDEFITWVNGIQIASESFIEEIKHKRILGANRTILDSTKVEWNNVQDDIISIKINSDSQYIKFGENLCISNGSFNKVPEQIIFFQEESV